MSLSLSFCCSSKSPALLCRVCLRHLVTGQGPSQGFSDQLIGGNGGLPGGLFTVGLSIEKACCQLHGCFPLSSEVVRGLLQSASDSKVDLSVSCPYFRFASMSRHRQQLWELQRRRPLFLRHQKMPFTPWCQWASTEARLCGHWHRLEMMYIWQQTFSLRALVNETRIMQIHTRIV